jgi:hypothetical protein
MPEDQIPAHVVINTIKCELAQIVHDESYRSQTRLLFGEVSDKKEQPRLTLGLKIVDTRTSGFGIGASNILAFGGTLSPSFGFTATDAYTVDTQFVSTFPQDINKASLEICNTKHRMWNGIGLKAMILGLAEQVRNARAGQPVIQSSSLKYTVTFGVTRKRSLGPISRSSRSS